MQARGTVIEPPPTPAPPTPAPLPPTPNAGSSNGHADGNDANGRAANGVDNGRAANGLDSGVVNGRANGHAAGAVAVALPVQGDGWYDHEFGGDGAKGEAPTGDAASPGVGGGGLGLPDVQWVWAGLQLDDGSEVVYARTLDTTSLGSIVDKAVLVGRDGASRNADAEMAQVGAWTSLRTFIKYGCRWALRVPSEELVLELAAVADDQELISVIATPAYWEGQVRVTGSRRGVPVLGVGFVEQYFGAQNHDFRTMLGGVSEVVLRNVEAVYPLAPSRQHLVELTISTDLPPSPPISPYLGP